MYALKELLADALSTLVGPRRARQGGVLDAWPDVIGAARARHARPIGIRGQTLLVAADHPAVYYELGLQRASLIEALNARAGGRVITEIHLTMRPLGASEAETPLVEPADPGAGNDRARRPPGADD
jgi:predicted nucleic acid-binding Zn ribbon protein